MDHSPPSPATPNYFAGAGSTDFQHAYLRYHNKLDNLRLWQEQTSMTIPTSHIEAVVYGDIPTSNLLKGETPKGNKFIEYIRKHNDTEIVDFLTLATTVAQRRSELASVWYYPANRNQDHLFNDLIEQCKQYKGTRFAMRYALQHIRCLFASQQYEECIRVYETQVSKFPKQTPLHRMAEEYVAGCWSRLGKVEKANRYFALGGDFNSIKSANRMEYAKINPNARSLWSHINYTLSNGSDISIRAMLPTAQEMTKGNIAKYKGDWYFLQAYIEGEYNHNYARANTLIYKALNSKFSNNEMRGNACAYRMAVHAELSFTGSLLSDLQRIDREKDRFLGPNWVALTGNIIQARWLPNLLRTHNYTLAILLANYCDEVFNENKYDYFGIYRSMSFQLMYSLKGNQLAYFRGNLHNGDSLQSFLVRRNKIDDQLLCELIGTIYLREQKYHKAIPYLEKVGEGYQRSMNIYEYLARDPFYAYNPLTNMSVSGYSSNDFPKEALTQDKMNAKLRFAKRMVQLERIIKQTTDEHEKIMAEFDYANGVRNAQESCWALTQYYSGFNVEMRYIPHLKHFSNYSPSDQLKVEKKYEQTIIKLLASTTDPETLAEINYRMRNYRTIAKRYPNTTIAKHLSTSCDNWKHWINPHKN